MRISISEYNKFLKKNGLTDACNMPSTLPLPSSGEMKAMDSTNLTFQPSLFQPSLFQPSISQWPYSVISGAIAASIKIHIVPVAKQRPRFSKGNVYTPKKTADYERMISQELSRQYRLPVDSKSKFGLRCFFWRPNRQRIDCDNLIKAVSDATTGVIWKDDSQVTEVFGRLWLASDTPCVEIMIFRVEDSSPQKTCPVCGKILIHNRKCREQTYCSIPCKSAAMRVQFTCPVCSELFTLPKNQAQRFISRSAKPCCSRSCGMTNSIARRRGSRVEEKKCLRCEMPLTKKKYTYCRSCWLSTASDNTRRWMDSRKTG